MKTLYIIACLLLACNCCFAYTTPLDKQPVEITEFEETDTALQEESQLGENNEDLKQVMKLSKLVTIMSTALLIGLALLGYSLYRNRVLHKRFCEIKEEHDKTS